MKIESARIVIEQDIDPDLSWLDCPENYEGCSAEEVAQYVEQDRQRLATYGVDWVSLGVWAEATVRHSNEVGTVVRSGGLWGVESDTDYAEAVGTEQLAELADMLAELGLDSSDIAEAIADAGRSDRW